MPPVDDRVKYQIDYVSPYEKARKTVCSGLDDKKKCIESEIRKCTRPFYEAANDTHINAANVCEQADNARICLVNFNKSCKANVIKQAADEMNDAILQCEMNAWKVGRCSKVGIDLCIRDFAIAVFSHEGKKDESGCNNKKKMDAAWACLKAKRELCTSKVQAESIRQTGEMIAFLCPKL